MSSLIKTLKVFKEDLPFLCYSVHKEYRKEQNEFFSTNKENFMKVFLFSLENPYSLDSLRVKDILILRKGAFVLSSTEGIKDKHLHRYEGIGIKKKNFLRLLNNTELKIRSYFEIEYNSNLEYNIIDEVISELAQEHLPEFLI